MKPRTLFAVLALHLLGALPAAAQGGGGPSALVVTTDNRTAAAEAARGAPRRDAGVRPGDVLRYRLTFTNVAGRPVRSVALSNPLPEQFRFVPGSTRASREDARAEYSADGGRSFSLQPMEEVVVDGRRVQRPVAPERYTHVRWIVGGWVAPGATVTAEFEARLPAPARGTGAAEPAAGRGGR
ncbi:MAG TPA: hypothetical protein VHG28_07200 [Longimicrobiaceae bacterium]|nr:hypothetical protein [Longimicrobiaceae bacterium]